MILALFLAIIFFVCVNKLQSSIGILPMLARKYPTTLDCNPKQTLWKLDHLVFLEKEKNLNTKRHESRPWLIITPMQDGLFIKQSLVLNIFPRKLFIPWQDLKLIETKGLIKKKYMYQVNVRSKHIYMVANYDLLAKQP